MSDLQSLSLSDALQKIRDKAKEIDNTRVYICLKRMRFKPVRVDTIENVKLLIALNEFSLPVTTNLWATLRNDDSDGGNTLAMLHTLGDKKILTLRRSEHSEVGNRHSWILSDTFKQHYYQGKDASE